MNTTSSEQGQPAASHTPESIWLKWYQSGPVGYINTGVYCASTDSYLWKTGGAA